MDKFRLEICVLWEDELRAAAAALYALSKISRKDVAFLKAVMTALDICLAALYGIEDTRAIIVSSAPHRKRKHVRRDALAETVTRE